MRCGVMGEEKLEDGCIRYWVAEEDTQSIVLYPFYQVCEVSLEKPGPLGRCLQESHNQKHIVSQAGRKLS